MRIAINSVCGLNRSDVHAMDQNNSCPHAQSDSHHFADETRDFGVGKHPFQPERKSRCQFVARAESV